MDFTPLLVAAQFEPNGGYWSRYDAHGYRVCEVRQLSTGGWLIDGRLTDAELAALLKSAEVQGNEP